VVATTLVLYQAALNLTHATKWQAAMLEEYRSITMNMTYDLVELPAGCKVIDTCWLFKLKRLASGIVDWWIAKGYTQIFGVDFNETFSLVVCIEHLWLLIAIAVLLGYKIHQMDVTTAFLNATLTEENYVHQPEGFVDPEKLNHVCHLHKSLYGLKQALLEWNCMINSHLHVHGFQPTTADPCVYTKLEGKDVTFIAIYIDDCMIFAPD
jgi:hypothetical protein